MILNQTLKHVVEQSNRREITTDMIVEAEKRDCLCKYLLDQLTDEYCWDWVDEVEYEEEHEI